MALRIKFTNLFLAVLLFSNTFLIAQVPETGNWMIYFGNQNFGNNKWVWHNEVQYRNYNFLGNTEQLLLRTGIGKYLGENNSLLSLGYAFIYTRPLSQIDGVIDVNETNDFEEHRIWQQLLTRQTIGKVALTHRYRFEQRFFENNDFRLRLRYFIGANIPLNKPRMEEKTYYFSFYNELFMLTNQRDAPNLFDRNRLFGAIGYQPHPRLRFEIGLMRQSVSNSVFSRNQLQFVVFNNLPFKK